MHLWCLITPTVTLHVLKNAWSLSNVNNINWIIFIVSFYLDIFQAKIMLHHISFSSPYSRNSMYIDPLIKHLISRIFYPYANLNISNISTCDHTKLPTFFMCVSFDIIIIKLKINSMYSLIFSSNKLLMIGIKNIQNIHVALSIQETLQATWL